MFKTIQNSPGVITIFHAPKNPVSQQLLHLLNKSNTPVKSNANTTAPVDEGKKKAGSGLFSRLLTGVKQQPEQDKYTIDVQSNKLPTFNQYISILQTLSIHPDCKESFKKAFPKLSNEIKNSIIDLKTPNEFEFYSDFCDGKNFFNPPLVIDWENSLIATDEKGLNRILEHYKKSYAEHPHI